MILAKLLKMFVHGEEIAKRKSSFEACNLYTHSNGALPIYLVAVLPHFFWRGKNGNLAS